MRAVSIKQPWAWAIIFGGKDIENRTWAPRYRGPLLIHAGKRVIAGDYEKVCLYLREDGRPMPKLSDLVHGGIIGQVDLVDVVENHDSHWFGGPLGWVLKNPKPLQFQQCKGRLGLFGCGLETPVPGYSAVTSAEKLLNTEMS